MTDPDLTPEQDDAVRALLAGARHTDPAPPAVVARLDAELAALVAERQEVRAPVVTLASRRRRTAGTVLLAAAAVVVVGVGLGQVLPSTNDGNESAGSAADSSTRESAGDQDSGMAADNAPSPQLAPESDTKQGESSLRSQPASPLEAGLSSDAPLKPQVRRLRGLLDDTSANFRADSSCVLPDEASGADSTASVTFDGLPAALVFRAPIGAAQRVDIFVCGEAAPRGSVRLRTP